MYYVPPFDAVKGHITLANRRGQVMATCSYAGFQELLATLLLGVAVDERWYLTQYPDIAEAVQAGSVQSARQHFVHNGFFEGRLPYHMEVDEAWYLAEYPEVAEAIAEGIFESAQQHFNVHGYKEGRLPSRP